MDIFEAISTKRSIRAYTDEAIPAQTLRELITLGTKASTGSGMEPWGFVVIQGKEEIEGWSERIKAYLLEHLEDFPYLKQYESWLHNPKFSVFNHAGTLLILYGDPQSHWYKYDCTLAAGNIMLAAHAMGIGTCWIGFSEYMLNTSEFKAKYGVPEDYQLVCPLSMGYSKVSLDAPKRKAPRIFSGLD